MNGHDRRLDRPLEELRPYACHWELRDMPQMGFTFGARRVFASSEADAIARCRELVAKDNAWPERNVEVLEANLIELPPAARF